MARVPELFPGQLTDVPGLRVGHAGDMQALTGCTVVICSQGATAGVSVRGMAPGTRETDLLRPGMLVGVAHAILLTGGSAFGLGAADGVMRYLEEQGRGYDTGVARVPIVPSAVVFDLAIGDARVRPDAAMGYAACQAASQEGGLQGNVGAGTGCSVGKLMGVKNAVKAGLGTASLRAGRLVVAALVATNAFGDVVDPTDGRIVAGALNPRRGGFLGTSRALQAYAVRRALAFGNTIIGVIATNAHLDVAETNELAATAHDGIARTVRPAHTLFDGDTLFALSVGRVRAHRVVVSEMAVEVTARAILNSVWAAEDAGGLRAARSLG